MMSKPIECKKCGKLNKPDAAICWQCGEDIQPKMTPKEAIHSEIKFRHEVLHKRRVRSFWIFTFITLLVTFGFIIVNSIYGVFRDVKENNYDAYVSIYETDGKTYIDVEFLGINMKETRMSIDSIILSNDDKSLEISASNSNPWDVKYQAGVLQARLTISTPLSELDIYNEAKVTFSYAFFSVTLGIPEGQLIYPND